MTIKDRVNVVSVIAIALFFYLSSELFLRETTVSKIDRRKQNMDALLADLPPGISDAVRKKVERMALDNALKAAKTDKARLNALLELASYVTGTDEAPKFYKLILEKYPNNPRSLQAYLFFLGKKKGDVTVSNQQFQKFILNCPLEQRFFAFSSGYAKLQKLNIGQEERLTFLLPLLDMKPKFWDYRRLYLVIGELAEKLGKADIVKKAEAKAKLCLDLPTIEEYSIKLEEEQMKKSMSKNKKGKK